MRCLVLSCLVLAGCNGVTKPVATIPYTQHFDGPLGPEWFSPSGGWSVVDGRLYNAGAHNVPFWLSADLPKDVRISFTAQPMSDDVDFKFEAFGDGEHHESGYSVIIGGWHNTTELIGRFGEHAPKRTDADDASVRAQVADNAKRAETVNKKRRDSVSRKIQLEPRKVYNVVFVKKGNVLELYLNGELQLSYFDPSPLYGPGHDRFAFANWASSIYFDDLEITAAPASLAP